MTAAVLDSSALLAMLLSEPGWDRVLAAMSEAAMTTVNLSETAAYFARKGAERDEIRSAFAPLPFERVPFDEDLALAAATLLPATRRAGLSLGDRACLALAQRLDAPALTADRQWARVSSAIGVRVELIR